MTHTGFRLHPEKDADILTDLAKYKDKTARLKEIYRKGLRYEHYEDLGGRLVEATRDLTNRPLWQAPFGESSKSSLITKAGQEWANTQIDIKVNNKKVEPKEQAKANILQGFGD